MNELIERLAREAGMSNDADLWFTPAGDPFGDFDVSTECLTRFAALVAEEAAKVCDERAAEHEECYVEEQDERFAVYAKHERRCAAAILAKFKTHT